jgi:hypothetical protein
MHLIFPAFLMGIVLMSIALTGCSNDAEKNTASSNEKINVDTVAIPEGPTDPQEITSEDAEDQQPPRQSLDLSLPDDIGIEERNTAKSYNVSPNLFDAKELFKDKEDENSLSISVTPSFNYNKDIEELELDGGSVSLEVKTK